MTELEKMQWAKMYMDKLAQGIDPITDREIPENSTLNNVRLARCFFYVSDILGRMIVNERAAAGKTKLLPFSVTPEQLSRVQLSGAPLSISQIAELLNAAVDNPQMKKLRTTAITDWLLEKGFLEKQTAPNGKSRRVPTPAGLGIGMRIQTRQGKNGEYQAVYYNAEAQQFVLDNLDAMLTEE